MCLLHIDDVSYYDYYYNDIYYNHYYYMHYYKDSYYYYYYYYYYRGWAEQFAQGKASHVRLRTCLRKHERNESIPFEPFAV